MIVSAYLPRNPHLVALLCFVAKSWLRCFSYYMVSCNRVLQLTDYNWCDIGILFVMWGGSGSEISTSPLTSIPNQQMLPWPSFFMPWQLINSSPIESTGKYSTWDITVCAMSMKLIGIGRTSWSIWREQPHIFWMNLENIYDVWSCRYTLKCTVL